MITLLGCAALLVAAVWVLALVFREEPKVLEICVEGSCRRRATHQRPVAIAADGSEVVELVCRRHGTFPR